PLVRELAKLDARIARRATLAIYSTHSVAVWRLPRTIGDFCHASRLQLASIGFGSSALHVLAMVGTRVANPPNIRSTRTLEQSACLVSFARHFYLSNQRLLNSNSISRTLIITSWKTTFCQASK